MRHLLENPWSQMLQWTISFPYLTKNAISRQLRILGWMQVTPCTKTAFMTRPSTCLLLRVGGEGKIDEDESEIEVGCYDLCDSIEVGKFDHAVQPADFIVDLKSRVFVRGLLATGWKMSRTREKEKYLPFRKGDKNKRVTLSW